MSRRQNVFVPEYPSKKVYEEYHGIPEEEYLLKTKEALMKFINERTCKFTVRTLRSTEKNIEHLFVNNSSDGYIKIHSDGVIQEAIKPTKYGFDKISWNRDRFWLFNDDTLDELDIICQNM